MRGILTVSAVIGLLAGNIAWAKMPFFPPKKIKVMEWKSELKWSEDVANKIVAAQANFDNRDKLIKGKRRKETSAFTKALEQRDPAKAEVDAFTKMMADLTKEQWDNDISFVMDVKKALKPDQQAALTEKMTPMKKSRASKEDKDDDQ